MIISRAAAVRVRLEDRSAKFCGNEKLHRNSRGLCLLTHDRCSYCSKEDCRPVRASILRSLNSDSVTAPTSDMSSREAMPGGTRKGRKVNHDARLIREIEPSLAKIARERFEIDEASLLKAYHPVRDHLFDDLRKLTLEIVEAKRLGGRVAERATRLKQKRLFVSWLTRLEKDPGYARQVAEQAVNYADFFFSSHDRTRDPFEPLLRDLTEIARERKAERQSLLFETRKR